MKIKFLLNPVSGKCRAGKLWPKIKNFFDERKIAYHLEKTTAPNQATQLAKKAVGSGFDTVVSIGGDGLTNEIANGMIGSQATLGIIPCGEADDFPKMLGLSGKDWEGACKVIAGGPAKKMDVGMINGRYFLNVVGIGIDGEIVEAKARAKKYMPGFLGYFLQSLLALLLYKPKKVNIRFNGKSVDATVLSLSIGNGKCCGGGFLFTPEAELDDGILDVCLVRFTNRLKMIWDLPKVPKAEHVKLPYVSMYKAKELTATSDMLMTCHIDGEVAKAHKFEIKIFPQKLKVLAKKP
jgi:YegS/Rv2252/BmrU family lipid kinase